jgi:hypothetical protein
MLIEHPAIEQRLREEISAKIGSERGPTSGDIRELKYLRAFLNGETLTVDSRPTNIDVRVCYQRFYAFMQLCT